MFSLRTLFIVVSIAALTAAAFGSQSIWWASYLIALTAVLFVSAIVARHNPFWRAFAACGIGYLVLASISILVDQQSLRLKHTAGHCAVALLFGLSGGLIHERQSERREQQEGEAKDAC